MKLDILVFAAHPDDAELACSGTIMKHIALDKKIGIVDLTAGEMGTRGTAQTRKEESIEASRILGIHVRENLNMDDCFFQNDQAHQLEIMKMIRKYQPEIVLANATEDRHPDHGRASALVSEACFKSGLPKVITVLNGSSQEAWRPQAVYHYIQDRYITPDFVVDITEFMDRKMQAIRAFKTQFFVPDAKDDSSDPETYISGPDFIETIVARAREYGKFGKGAFAEGFTSERTIAVSSLFDIV